MYEYKFVRLKFGFFAKAPKEDYKAIIKQHAKEGWKLVQIFSPAIRGYGAAAYFEMIFEKSTEF